MTAEEYFGDWINVIDKAELFRVMNWIKTLNPDEICPNPRNIFRAFKLCPPDKCLTIILSQDPYPQPGIATGIAFGNNADTPEDRLSPSLQVIKEAVINYEIPHNLIEFDNTLESWAKQGILLLNSALTCKVNMVGSHYDIWKPFISKLIHNITSHNGGIIFVLFGNQAQSFKKDIVYSPAIFEYYHPAYYARKGLKMPHTVFSNINRKLKELYNYQIEFYKETEYGNC